MEDPGKNRQLLCELTVKQKANFSSAIQNTGHEFVPSEQ